MKLKFLIIFIFVFVLFLINVSADFNISADICDTAWYCSEYDQGTCGNRLCLDLNDCNTTRKKPSEYLSCSIPEAPSSSGGSSGSSSARSSGGSSGGSANTLRLLEAKYNFVLKPDLFKIQTVQDQIYEEIMTLYSLSASDYSLNFKYPSNFDQNLQFITVEKSNFSLNDNSSLEFKITVDSTGIRPGVYVVPLIIKNKYNEKQATFIITVSEKETYFDYVLEVSKESKIVDKNSLLDSSIEFFDDFVGKEVIVDYSMVDFSGEEYFYLSQKHIVQKNNSIKRFIEIPKNVVAGYYLLSTKVYFGKNSRSKNEVFVVVPNLENVDYAQLPAEFKKVGESSNVWIFVLVVILFVVVMLLIFISRKVNYVDESPKIKSVKRENDKEIVFDKEDGVSNKKFLKVREVLIPKKEPVIEKDIAGLFSRNVSDDDSFMLDQGGSLYSLNDLLNSLNSMDSSVFKHHVNDERNDFFNWIVHCFNEKVLADKVKFCKTKEDLEDLLEKVKEKKVLI